MEIPIKIETLPVLTCGRCRRATLTVMPDKIYCRLRMEIINQDERACKHVEAKPIEEEGK